MSRPLQGLIETMREFEGGPDPLTYFTKGHVDKAEFAAEVRAYCGELEGKGDWWDSTGYTAGDVEHVWYRNVPAGREFPGGMIMHRCDGPGRGIYPATEIDIEKAGERRRCKEVFDADRGRCTNYCIHYTACLTDYEHAFERM